MMFFLTGCGEYSEKDIVKELNKKISANDGYMLEGNLSRKKRKKKIDALAATIILQTYLDRKGE